jgi:hypothetical protein
MCYTSFWTFPSLASQLGRLISERVAADQCLRRKDCTVGLCNRNFQACALPGRSIKSLLHGYERLPSRLRRIDEAR